MKNVITSLSVSGLSVFFLYIYFLLFPACCLQRPPSTYLLVLYALWNIRFQLFWPSGSYCKSCGAIIICVRHCDTYYTLYTHRIFKNDDHLPDYFLMSVLKRYSSISSTTAIICCNSHTGNKAVFISYIRVNN